MADTNVTELQPKAEAAHQSLPSHTMSYARLQNAQQPGQIGRRAHRFLATPTVLPRRPVVLVCWPFTRRPQ